MAESRLDQLTRMLRERDFKDATAREEARKVQLEADQRKAAEERQAARIAEMQSVRRGCWINSALAKADPAAPFDLASVVVPDDPNLWPEGVDPSTFAFVPKPKPADASAPTSLGKLLATNMGVTK